MMSTRFILLLLFVWPEWAICQSPGGFALVVVNEHRQPVAGATVRLMSKGKVVNSLVAGEDGRVVTGPVGRGVYRFLISGTGYQPKTTEEYKLPGVSGDTIILMALNTSLQEVTVTGRVPPVERRRDRTIVNVEASVTNTGSTVLEVLERSPGVTVDRNGGITLNGKQGVTVMIDDRLTYLSGEELNDLLSSMSASQVSKIELIPNPPAKYDASGSAGIINIKTKKSSNDGFNGSLTTSYGQGVYPKNNNSLTLNYRKGRVNAFLNYTFSVTKYLTDLYAYRQYFDDSKDVTAILRQPSYFAGIIRNHTVKTGMDYTVTPGTTVGLVLTGTDIHRKAVNNSRADWLEADGSVDSSVVTVSRPANWFRSGGVNLNGKQRLSRSADLSVDLDYLHYPIQRDQDFKNHLDVPGGYEEIYRSRIPTTIDVFSGKADATVKLSADLNLQAGGKLSSNHTDNAAVYENFESQQWVKDDTRSNHFVYRENIRAAYGTIERKMDRWSYQAGLRYEYTSYNGHQLGNTLQKDSTLSRHYGGLFPSGYLSYKVDTLNSLTLTVARRIDRPAFQSLNPFLYIINKYTYEKGNAYLLPQYSWNIELTHQYGELLTTGVSYSLVSDYFSQIFLSDTVKSILYYTQGNVGQVHNLGVTASLSLTPARWWTMELTAVYNYKQLRGFNGSSYTSTINQLNVNVNNQLNFGKGYTGELSGFYTTRARNDIQELLYPAGQVSTGVSKGVLKKKGTIKLSYRDIFYTAAMEGLTTFPNATEYFKMKRDTRVLTLAFTYRFGKTFKVSRHQEGADEERERIGNGS